MSQLCVCAARWSAVAPPAPHTAHGGGSPAAAATARCPNAAERAGEGRRETERQRADEDRGGAKSERLTKGAFFRAACVSLSHTHTHTHTHTPSLSVCADRKTARCAQPPTDGPSLPLCAAHSAAALTAVIARESDRSLSISFISICVCVCVCVSVCVCVCVC